MKSRIIYGVAGTLILISVLLTYITDQLNWLLLATFVGVNLLQSAFTKWCLLAVILDRAGIKE